MVKQISLSRALRTGAAGGLIALALAACGGTSTTTSPTSAAPAATAAAPSAPTAATGDTTAPTAAMGDAPTAATGDTTAPTAASSTEATSAPAAMAKLNLNEVTEEQLTATIPNFSARMVREFMEYRPYVSIQQFRKEIGKYVSAEEVTAY